MVVSRALDDRRPPDGGTPTGEGDVVVGVPASDGLGVPDMRHPEGGTPTGEQRPSLLESRLQPTWNDARYRGNVWVRYPFHPLYQAPNLSVCRKFGCHNVGPVELAVALRQRQAVPAWMLDEERCAQVTIGLEPTVDLAALLSLTDWLQAQDL